MKWFLSLTIFLSCFHIASSKAFCSEAYYINNNKVFLLYKLINWWNQSSSKESTWLCGRPIKCRSKGDTQVYYDESQKTLKFDIKGGFADMLSIFKQCEHCFGPSFMQCTWLNKKYFGHGEAAILRNELSAINALFFKNIGKKEIRLIQNIEKDIEIVLEGVIGGLLQMNGKIALHQSGKFLKECPEVSQSQENHFPISLKIINSRTEEIIAKYTAIWQN